MNALLRYTRILALASLALFALDACKSSKYGKQVNEPFSGNAYESNRRFWRATGKGQSAKDNVAVKKADIEAKTRLAGQVQVTMKEVSDQYLQQKETANAAEVLEKMESLSRQTMNTELTDLRKIGEKKYYNEEKDEYTVFVAYEIRKKSMLYYMKKIAKAESYDNEAQRKAIVDIIEEEIRKAEAEDNE
jgi:hypothetical protein